MADRPLLFSGLMVQALLAGRKTQTRRLLKPQPDGHVWRYGWSKEDGATFSAGNELLSGRIPIWAGDRLWVKETWRAHGWHADCVEIAYAAQRGMVGWSEQHEQIRYPGGDRNAFKYYAPKGPDFWRPSIFMPRWASRLTLLVTDVRVERLQDISEDDAIAEGVVKVRDACHVIRGFDYDRSGLCHTHAVTPYAKLWDHINGDGSWSDNPWVIAYTFSVIKQNIDQIVKEAA